MAYTLWVGKGKRGKTQRAVMSQWRVYRKNQARLRLGLSVDTAIISNTPLIDLRVKRVPNPDPGFRGDSRDFIYVPVDPLLFGRSWADDYIKVAKSLYELSDCEVLIDEVKQWFQADEWRELNKEKDLVRFIAQERKDGVNVKMTDRSERIFIDFRENMNFIIKCYRYGPFPGVGFLHLDVSFDPASPEERPRKSIYPAPTYVHDIYSDLAIVGGRDGQDYRSGRTRKLRPGEGPFFYDMELPTLEGGVLRYHKRLRASQAECLIRNFGPSSVGLDLEELRSVRQSAVLERDFPLVFARYANRWV